MVVLNVVIVVMILRFAAVLPFVPPRYQQTGWAIAIRTALIGVLLFIPALIVIRETQRASVRGTAVELSPTQYSDLYQTADDFARRLRLRRRPQIYLANGNGTLNAFAAQATGHDYVVLANELFVNLYNGNRDGLRFILGHEMGHIRLHHVSLWYQISVAYSEPIPLLGPALSRLREYSCDRYGAYLTVRGHRPGSSRIQPVHRERCERRRAGTPGKEAAWLLGRVGPATKITPVHRASPRTAVPHRPVPHPRAGRPGPGTSCVGPHSVDLAAGIVT